MKIKLEKDTWLCILALVIIVVSYAGERCVELFCEPTAKLGMLMALVLAALLCVVVAILAKTEDSFTGLLAALVGYKMMPADISFLSTISLDGNVMYYLLMRASNVIFLVLIFRLYNMQEKPRKITALPLCAMILAVPFTNTIGMTMTNYFLLKTGSMLGGYFSQYICYALAAFTILALSFVSTYPTMRFAAYFEFTALSINIMRYIAKIVFKLAHNMHISKSYYGWIALYVSLIIIFFIAKSIKKKNVYDI